MTARMVGALTGMVVLLLLRGTRREADPASWSRSTRRGGRAPIAPYVLLSSMACPSLSGNVGGTLSRPYRVRICVRRKDRLYGVRMSKEVSLGDTSRRRGRGLVT